MTLVEKIKHYVEAGYVVEINCEDGVGVMVLTDRWGFEEDIDLGEMGGDMSIYTRAGATVYETL